MEIYLKNISIEDLLEVNVKDNRKKK